MTDKTKSPYETVCKAMAYSDTWPLIDAIYLLVGRIPEKHAKEALNEPESVDIKLLHDIALNCAGHSLKIANPDRPPEEYRVLPDEFLSWADFKAFPIPPELSRAHIQVAEKLTKHQKTSPLYVHHKRKEKCRAIAALIWDKNKDITIKDMTEFYEIRRFGCEDTDYSEKTLRDWIKDLAPNRKPGRPKKNKSL